MQQLKKLKKVLVDEDYMYRLLTQNGVLDKCYLAADLLPLDETLAFDVASLTTTHSHFKLQIKLLIKIIQL